MADLISPVPATVDAERKRVYVLEQTVTERFYYDPLEIAQTFNWEEIEDNYQGTFDDFIIETFQTHQGSEFADHWFHNDANPSVGVELSERWDDE